MALWPFPIIKVLHVNVKKEILWESRFTFGNTVMNNFLVQFFLDTWDIIPFEMIFE